MLRIRGPTLTDSSSALGSDSGSKTSQPDLLCFSHLRWHFVTQRPQHLLNRASRDRRVFYWEEPVWYHDDSPLPPRADGSLGMHLEIVQEGPSLWMLRPHISWGIDFEAGQRLLLAEFMEQFHVSRYVRWYYTPMALGFSGDLAPEATVYDCMDELAAFLGAPSQLVEREQELFAAADVVFTGGISLYEAKQRQHANVHAFPSSIDVAHFAQSYDGEAEPADQAPIAHPRAGFYGVVDERFDIALLAETAQLQPGVQFVILGPVVKIDPASLPQVPNIHYLGSKSYDELPRYLAGWDVALLPFALNEATRFISPTKTPEYLAAGKPVVSTPIRDVIRGYGDAGLVAIAGTPEAFAKAIVAALEPQPEAWRVTVREKLSTDSWDSTWAAMRAEIDRVRSKRARVASDSGREPARKTHKTHSSLLQSVSLKPASSVASLRIDLPRDMSRDVQRLEALLTFKDPRSGHRKAGHRHTEHFDYVVVGAGFAGGVLAERLASQLNARVLVVDKRDHIAGNAYDFYNADGLLVHKYGPHIFHTNSEAVLQHLSRFTAWRPYEHRVLSSVDNQLVPVPINLDTINQLYKLSLDATGMEKFLAERAVTSGQIRTSEDIVISRVGRELYEKFFRNYTRKQWGLDPSQLDAAVAGRIPVRTDRDDRYFTDAFQVMPLDGYTRMFERMLDHPNITVRTGVDYRDASRTYAGAKIIYTGPIDEYFGFRYGPLPYRSLDFKHETHDREFFQQAPVINYPNDHAYTRVTEFKYLTGQKHAKTSIVYEYPCAEGDPYYPIPRPENALLYAKYRELAERDGNVHFCGRLANYKYLNMDQVVAQALTTFRRIATPHTLAIPALVGEAQAASV